MLERAVAAAKTAKAKALYMFNKGEGDFKHRDLYVFCKHRDLYVFCANAWEGTLTAHPSLKGEHLQDIKGKKGSKKSCGPALRERLAPVSDAKSESVSGPRELAMRTS
jgi:hypothetical protein